LLAPLVQHDEVVAGQVAHRLACPVLDNDIHFDQAGGYAQGWLLLRRRSRTCLPLNKTSHKHDTQPGNEQPASAALHG